MRPLFRSDQPYFQCCVTKATYAGNSCARAPSALSLDLCKLMRSSTHHADLLDGWAVLEHQDGGKGLLRDRNHSKNGHGCCNQRHQPCSRASALQQGTRHQCRRCLSSFGSRPPIFASAIKVKHISMTIQPMLSKVIKSHRTCLPSSSTPEVIRRTPLRVSGGGTRLGRDRRLRVPLHTVNHLKADPFRVFRLQIRLLQNLRAGGIAESGSQRRRQQQ